MGNKPGGSKYKVQHALFQHAAQKFDLKELKELKLKFKNFAERSKGATVDKATFLRVFPLPGILGERLFTLFDIDKSGVIDYEEFVVGLAMFCRGTQKERLQVMFSMYDLAGDNAIHKQELAILLRHMPEETLRANVRRRKRSGSVGNGVDDASTVTTAVKDISSTSTGGVRGQGDAGVAEDETNAEVDVNSMVEQAFDECDLNHDGKLSFDQFNLWVTQNQDLADWFNHEMNDTIFESAGVLNNGTPESPDIRPITSPPATDGRPGGSMSSLTLSETAGAEKKFGIHCAFCPAVVCFCGECGMVFAKEDYALLPEVGGSLPRPPLATAAKEEGQVAHGEQDGTSGGGNIDVISASAFLAVCRGCGAKKNCTFCANCGGKFPENALTSRILHLPAPTSFYDNHDGLFSTRGQSLSKDDSSAEDAGAGFGRGGRLGGRLSMTSISHSGWLYKEGGRLHIWTRRFYWIDGKFCYYSKSGKDFTRPDGAIYLEGSFVSKLGQRKETSSKYFGIEIMTASGGERDTRQLFATTEEDRDAWLKSLHDASNTRNMDLEYRIKEQIGLGRFSKVFKCVHIVSQKEYAVKVMRKDDLKPHDLELMRTEIAVMKLVRHPHIISLRDIFETKSNLNIIMEYVRGGELFQHIVGRKRFSELEAYKLIQPVASKLTP